ncbi:MAG: hypothetical protein KAH77_01780 [Thiomargarita sp.]|nr:hypothetical protein [Thiomargarita sp.]
MDTIREQIIKRIISLLQNISVDNDYNHTLGLNHIYRNEPIINKEQMPATSIWELSESRERNKYGGTVRRLMIRIEILMVVTENRIPATISNELLGDLETALIMGDITLDELIEDIQDVAAHITHTTCDSHTLASASIDFEIKYITEWGDPYTLS